METDSLINEYKKIVKFFNEQEGIDYEIDERIV